MNVLLVNPNYGVQLIQGSVPLGLLSIATFLKERGFHVRLYDRNTEKVPLEEVLAAFSPHAAGVSVTTAQHLGDAVAISSQLRALEVPMVWGGNMASGIPELILREGSADYVVEGEGEITFCELLEAIEAKQGIAQIKGIVYLDASGCVCHTPDREFADLADLPIIDWSFIDPNKHFASHMHCKKMMHLYYSKGCPGRCAFCANEEFHRCTYRKRPNGYVISEIKELAEKYGMDGVSFADESFGMHKGDLYDLCGRLRALNLDIVWSCQTRLGHLKREDLQCMFDSGCRRIYYGVESGSPGMLERIHKPIDLSKIDREIRDCREIGISVISGFIIGFPDETEEELRDTVRLMLRLNTNQHQVTMFLPAPGSEFYRYLVEQGRLTQFQTLRTLVESKHATTYGSFANYSNVPARDLQVIQSFFQWRRLFGRYYEKSVPKGTQKNAPTYATALHTVLSSLSSVWKQGFFSTCRDMLSLIKIAFSVAWFTFAFPGVRKKYGLYMKNRRKSAKEHRS